MCGRYTLTASGEVIAEVFDLKDAPQVVPRFNIAPTQEAPVVRQPEPGESRSCDALRWGLIPFWAKDPDIGNRMINARAETITEKPSFRTSFRRRRCLAVMSGFYEWQERSGPKQPFYIRRSDHRPMAVAAIWDRWQDASQRSIETFALITTEAAPGLATIHHRMPVILEPPQFTAWLDPGQEEAASLTQFLQPFATENLTWHPVSRFVNSPANDTPSCIEPLTS